jgi:hypothetical protein
MATVAHLPHKVQRLSDPVVMMRTQNPAVSQELRRFCL